MAFSFPYPFVEEVCTTTGTGDYSLGGAVPGCSAFGTNLVDGDVVPCAVVDGVTPGIFETGYYKYNVSGNKLSRLIIDWTSNNDQSPINWAAGAKLIRLCPIAGSLYMAVQYHSVGQATAPTVSNDKNNGYLELAHWQDNTHKRIYELLDSSAGAAVWLEKNTTEQLRVKEGSNLTMGTLTMNGTTGVVVSTTKVTATSRIFLTHNVTGGTPGFAYVDTRSNGVSFTVKGTAGDTSTVAWLLVEPA